MFPILVTAKITKENKTMWLHSLDISLPEDTSLFPNYNYIPLYILSSLQIHMYIPFCAIYFLPYFNEQLSNLKELLLLPSHTKLSADIYILDSQNF